MSQPLMHEFHRSAAELDGVCELLEASLPKRWYSDAARRDAESVQQLQQHASQIAGQLQEAAQDAASLEVLIAMMGGSGA